MCVNAKKLCIRCGYKLVSCFFISPSPVGPAYFIFTRVLPDRPHTRWRIIASVVSALPSSCFLFLFDHLFLRSPSVLRPVPVVRLAIWIRFYRPAPMPSMKVSRRRCPKRWFYRSNGANVCRSRSKKKKNAKNNSSAS